MKKVFKLLMIGLSMCIIMTSFALASDTVNYTLEDLYMQVSIPTELAVFTRNIADDDPNLAKFGLDKQSLEEHFRASNIYLNAIADDGSHELVITMNTNDGIKKVFNFNLYNNQYDNDAIKEVEESIRDEYISIGCNITNFSTYQVDTAKYFIIDFTRTAEGTSVYSRQFYTVYNGQAISFVLNSLTGEITSELEAELQGVVDSVAFTETLPTPNDTYASEGRAFNWRSIFDKAATGYMVGGIGAFIFAVVFTVIKAIKKKKSKKLSIESKDI